MDMELKGYNTSCAQDSMASPTMDFSADMAAVFASLQAGGEAIPGGASVPTLAVATAVTHHQLLDAEQDPLK